jgi:tetratricopeptide (TPR) repeat protein
LYAELLKSGPPDATEYNGLGDAQFALANYRRAGEAYRNVLKIDISNRHAASRAETCEKILALDPEMPGIGAKDRYQRSRVMLSNIADELSACAASQTLEHPESKAKLAEARTLLSEKGRPASFSDAADTTMSVAIELWKARVASCTAPRGDSPLQRIMAKLTAR